MANRNFMDEARAREALIGYLYAMKECEQSVIGMLRKGGKKDEDMVAELEKLKVLETLVKVYEQN